MLFVLAGKMFKMNLAKALQMQAKSKQVFREFDKTFPEHIVKEWDNMVKAWDKDMSQPNPYAEPIAGKTQPHRVVLCNSQQSRNFND